LAEYGIGSAVELFVICGNASRNGIESCGMQTKMRGEVAVFMNAWGLLKLSDTFRQPGGLLQTMCGERSGYKRLGINAIHRTRNRGLRHDRTETIDRVRRRFITAFRELAGCGHALFESFYPRNGVRSRNR